MKTNTLTIIALMFLIGSCRQSEELPAPKTLDEQLAEQGLTRTVLGKKLENPYSLKNMRTALDSMISFLKKTRDSDGFYDTLEVITTDLYVRFLPRDSIQYEYMMNDSTMVYYDHPLDYEIISEGDIYIPDDWEEGQQQWLYGVVKPDHEFSDTIQHEVLSELFIPENHPEFEDDGKSRSMDTKFLNIETIALLNTNNLDPEEEVQVLDSKGNIRAFWHNWFPPKWYPDGYIKVSEYVRDKHVKYLPVKNLRVRARRWFTIKTDYTDTNGYFRIGHFRRPVNYSIVFRSPYVQITNYMGWATRFNGPHSQSRWNCTFGWYSHNWVRATLMNAAHEFDVQRKRTGLRNPFPEGFWSIIGLRVNIRPVFESGKGSHWPLRENRVKIHSKTTQGDIRKTDDLYALVFHELGHQSHWKLNRWNTSLSLKIIRESWADFFEYSFTKEYYPDHISVRRSPSALSESIPDRDKAEMSDKYTTVFVDLMDADNQYERLGGERPDDKVFGYSFTQIQSAVKNSRNLDQVKNYLKSNYSNSTEIHLDELFDFYKDLQ